MATGSEDPPAAVFGGGGDGDGAEIVTFARPCDSSFSCSCPSFVSVVPFDPAFAALDGSPPAAVAAAAASPLSAAA